MRLSVGREYAVVRLAAVWMALYVPFKTSSYVAASPLMTILLRARNEARRMESEEELAGAPQKLRRRRRYDLLALRFEMRYGTSREDSTMLRWTSSDEDEEDELDREERRACRETKYDFTIR